LQHAEALSMDLLRAYMLCAACAPHAIAKTSKTRCRCCCCKQGTSVLCTAQYPLFVLPFVAGRRPPKRRLQLQPRMRRQPKQQLRQQQRRRSRARKEGLRLQLQLQKGRRGLRKALCRRPRQHWKQRRLPQARQVGLLAV
jgi:hypothetical protein